MALAIVSVSLYAMPADEKKEASDSASTSSSAKKNSYEKTFIKDKTCVTARCTSGNGGFMTLHKVNKKLYIELPKTSLGREMLLASTITQVSDANLASTGYKPEKPMHIRFTLGDSTTVFMQEVNVLPDYAEGNAAMARAVQINGMDPVIGTYPVFCYTPDKSGVVFEVTKLFTGGEASLAPIKSGTSGSVNMTVTQNSSASVLGDIKVFEDNASIKTTLSYTVSANMLGLLLLKDKDPFSVTVTRSFLLLPEKKMRPRIADSRVGIFLSNKYSLKSDKGSVETYSFIHRWNLQPSDSAAFAAGEPVEPVKPIVFYLDDAFPQEWREPVRKGILRWNSAFEEIGFRNAIRILDFPEDDPEFDPDNLKYSCIRYVPAMISNAMGPSWVDPSTGEIINASVIVYNDIVKLLTDWRFCQTAQVDERVRGPKLTKDVLEESIEYVIAHEVGHCLGFMHNMSASAAFPVDSLRSPSFTAANGTTPSIMDYARFNYVAQPQDKGVSLTPPTLGVYDRYLVRYAYGIIPEASSMEEEKPYLEALVDSHAGDPRFRYGRQQVIHRYDPSAVEEDLGDDPVRASDYGTDNIKHIMSHLSEWCGNDTDPDGTIRTHRYEALANQYNRYVNNVMRNIGGIYLTAVKPGTEGETAVAVDRQTQSESLKWVVAQLLECGWLNDRNLTEMMPLRVELEPIFQYYTAIDLFATYANVVLSSHVTDRNGESYTVQDWLDDINDCVWKNVGNRRHLTRGERTLQKLFVSAVIKTATKKSDLVKVKSIASDPYLPSVNEIVLYDLDPSGMAAENLSLLREYEEVNGKGSVAAEMFTDFGKAGYGWQYRVNTRTIDETKSAFVGELMTLEKYLKSWSKGADKETANHYFSLLHDVQEALGK